MLPAASPCRNPAADIIQNYKTKAAASPLTQVPAAIWPQTPLKVTRLKLPQAPCRDPLPQSCASTPHLKVTSPIPCRNPVFLNRTLK
jgi:hypothetical protein